MKKSFVTRIAAILFFVFILTAIPGLNYAEKKANKIDLNLHFSQSGTLLNYLFPWLNSIFILRNLKENFMNSYGIVCPTGTLSIGRPGKGD